MNRCTGRCCARFCLESPETIERRLEDHKAGRFQTLDIEQVSEMLIPMYPVPHSRDLWYYTCKNWDAASGDCMTYETRPEMCTAHGTSYPCNFEHCKMKGVMRERPEITTTNELKETPAA